MYRDAIEYKGSLLAPGSLAHKLHSEKKFNELDQHLKALDEKERKLLKGNQ